MKSYMSAKVNSVTSIKSGARLMRRFVLPCVPPADPTGSLGAFAKVGMELPPGRSAALWELS